MGLIVTVGWVIAGSLSPNLLIARSSAWRSSPYISLTGETIFLIELPERLARCFFERRTGYYRTAPCPAIVTPVQSVNKGTSAAISWIVTLSAYLRLRKRG